MTQSEQILNYMKEHGSITSMEAFSRLGITRLSARIYDLRKDGVKIVQERKYGTGGKHYDVFRLGESE